MSSEGLKSLIVTDPDLVDPEIDTSGLRTQTDTNPRLLASIADFPGISYDPTSFDYLSDLNELFAYGLPTTETDQAQIPGAIDTLVDTGGGGQATLPSITDTTSEPTFIGGGATLEDAGGVPELGGVYATDYQGDPLVDQMSEVSIPTQTINPLAEEMSEVSIPVVDPLAEEMSEVSIPITDTFIGGGATLEDAGGIPELGGGMGPDYQGDPNIIAPSGDIFAQGDPLAEEKIDVVTQEDVDNPTNLLQKLGIPEDFDIKKALIDTGINLVAGVPITLIAKGLEAVLPDDNIAPSTNTARNTGLLQGDNTVTQDIYGISTQTSFNPVKSTINYNDYNVKQVAKLENVLDDLKNNKYQGDEQSYLDNTKRLRQELEDRKKYLDAINKDPLYSGDIQDTGDASIAEQIAEENKITGDLPGGGNIVDEFAPSDGGPAPISTFDAEAEDEIYEEPPAPPSPPQGGGGRDRDDGPAPSAPSKPSVGTGSGGLGDYQVQPSGGGGGRDSGSSSKIVCSMMNESYGFGSFRNKIWLRHSKNLLPEYQKGYHKIFLPLVNYAKKNGVTNKIIKKIIEHLMVHRTIDIRQESRGKMHLLGRVYRKIFEPICYWVGKYAK